MAVNNATVLKDIWLNGSNDYQQRVPQATQSNIDAVRDAIFDPGNRSIFNEFHDALINRIGSTFVNRWTFANPLAPFKRDLLQMGAMIQEIQVDMIKAKGYDVRDSNLFKQNPAKVYEKFHEVNREDRYDLTINVTALRQAFTTEFGLNTLIARELEMLELSDQYDEYRIMVQLIGRAYANNELYKVATPFANPLAPTADELKAMSVAIRTHAGRMAFPSGRYNAEGVPTVSNKDDLVLIITPEVQANLDVNVLADAFHIDRADFAQRIVVIDEFPMAGVYAMLASREWFVCADYVKAVESFYNPKTRSINYYLHHWGVYSTSLYGNAIVFGDVEASNTGVVDVVFDKFDVTVVNADGDTVTTFDYEDDDKLKLNVVAGVTTTPDVDYVQGPQGYTVEITAEVPGETPEDEATPVALTLKTSIGRNGEVRVQEGLESGTVLTIKATSTYVNPSGNGKKPIAPLTDTVTLTVA